MSMSFRSRSIEVENREEGEYERLDSTDQQVEELPDQVQNQCEDIANGNMADRHDPERRDERQHQAAGQKVAEETQGEGYGLCNLFDDIDRCQSLIRLKVVPNVPPDSFRADRNYVHRDYDDDRQGESEVDVT